MLIYGLLLLLWASCAREDAAGNNEMGTFTMNLNASCEVIGMDNKSRAEARETSEDIPEENEALALPDVKDFSVAIYSLGEQVCGWNSYEEMCKEEFPELRAGTYQAKAWYGDVSKEGFELPYFEGNQEFLIKKGETTPVEVTCYLGNAQVKVNYTEAFKNYFSSYSSVIATSLGNEVEYVKDEARVAYFSPGELVAKVKVRKSGQANETTYQAKVFTAEARHIYTLTLDVDAGSTTMTVSFSDDVAGEEVHFDVSDAALNAPAPYFKANGFEENVPLEPIEGVKQEQAVTAYVNAVAGIKSCILTTTSEYLSGKGWPNMVDLVVPGEHTALLSQMGLQTKGLEGNRAQMAQVDFTALIENLPKGGSHIFKLEATDEYGKVSDKSLVLTVTPQGCEFSVTATSVKAPFNGNTCQVNVSFKDGNLANVHFHLAEGNKEALELVRSELVSEGELKTYTVYLKAPETVKFMNPFKISASYLSYNKETDALPVGIGILVDNPGDVWAKRAVFHVYNATDLASVKLQKQQGNSWTDVTTEVSGSYSLVAKGLDSGTALTFHAVEGDESSNSVNVTTEEELQVPNAGFEDFYDEYVWTGINVAGGNVDMYTFYPYAKGETDPWWSSRNALTTAKEGAGSWSYYYIVYPATTYVNSSWAASSKVGLPTVPCSGEKSAEIVSIGWGEGSTCTTGWLLGNKMSCEKTIAGALFIGAYTNGEEHHGHEFSSRPQKMTFSYRFHSYNSESASATIRLEHREGDQIYVLAEKELLLTPDMASTDIRTGELALDYSGQNEKYKATHISISFLSSTSDSPAYEPFYVADNLNGNRYSRAIGNVLVIDDVKLIYE